MHYFACRLLRCFRKIRRPQGSHPTKYKLVLYPCCLYGKLISILIGGHLLTLFKAFTQDKTDFELSEWKAYKIVKKTQKNLEMY